ncbi:monovalent cation:proton antiporter-2 (CPA2) family protein [Qingshengfaniella alkalisoli]|uniref:monovalent cation:proton antiporter-2 (CPA2) family protein n=1 Tax=Qingshengfaniella alkalisoli TaxID=2599296 RepID=UPI00143D5622|nr:monovalent cation:proton antiporter-2 (CPA2) family protein [Qingshengfaniella alkalisoli]
MIRPAVHRHARRASCVAAFLASLTTLVVPAHAAEAEGPLGLTSLELAFTEALALIALACLFVPLSKRFGLGTVIGYLVAGVAAGAVLRLSYAEHPEKLLHFAEFGVVLFLFVIGLEFRPRRLWELRTTIFGRGLVQVLACGLVLGGAAYTFGLDWRAAMIVGLGLALSSTALVMREIDEGGERRTPFGETAIAVLLFEDLAIVPLLLLVTLIAPTGAETTTVENVVAVALGLAAIAFLIAVGRYGLDPMFRMVARTRTPELMTAAALGVVIFASLVMALTGLSYAMGAFIAGMMLADSAFRHEVEADIEPFRALFLGLFFVAVGLSLDLGGVADNWLVILAAVPVLIVLKGIAIYLVSRLFGSPNELATRIAFAMAQHGEFGFVLFAAASSALILDGETASVVVSIVTLSMALSSQSDRAYRWVVGTPAREVLDEDYADAGGSVLVIGFGRVGQMVAQPLIARGVPITLLDHDANRIREAERFGARVHYGDGTRREVLHAAGAGEARAIVVATDDPVTTLAVASLVRHEFPGAELLVRAHDRIHAVRLANEGVATIVRETLASALELGGRTLHALGYTLEEIEETTATIHNRDERLLAEQTAMARGRHDRDAIVDAITPEPLTHTERADMNQGPA